MRYYFACGSKQVSLDPLAAMQPKSMDTIERRVARNTPRLILYFVAAGLVGTVGLRSTNKSDSPWVVALIRPVLAWVRVFAWIWVIFLVVVLGVR